MVSGSMMHEGGEPPTSDSEPRFAVEPLIPWYVAGVVALLCAIVLAALAVMGPLVLGSVHYRTSQSGIWQTEGADLVNLVLIVPILSIGGILQLLKRKGAKYFLVLSPITLMYTGFSLGIGQEWSNPAYVGNVEDYSWLFLILIVGGLVLLISSLPMFTPGDSPEFNRRNVKIFVAVMGLFLLMFAVMWLSEISKVISTGDTSSGSYSKSPTVFWTVRYLDLGVTIPLGFVALYLLLSKPKRAYSLVLLFFGFFITLGTAVFSMGVIMTLNHDPEAQAGALPIFATLMALSWGGLLYLVRDKLARLVSP